MDYVNLMAYDMVQSDSSVTGLLAPLSIIVSIYQTSYIEYSASESRTNVTLPTKFYY